MDAPLITLDDAANTTDLYAFLSGTGGTKHLTTALAVFPFEEPGIGPNAYRFDENVLYEIHVATGTDLAAGRSTFSYQFQFDSVYKNRDTILQTYLGSIESIDGASQNFTQTYTVRRVDQFGTTSLLGTGIVPPNNQGTRNRALQPAPGRRSASSRRRGWGRFARPVLAAVDCESQ